MYITYLYKNGNLDYYLNMYTALIIKEMPNDEILSFIFTKILKIFTRSEEEMKN